MAKDTFADFRNLSRAKVAGVCFEVPFAPCPFTGDRRGNPRQGWAMLCGYDERNYSVVIQKAKNDREIMIRIGCRFKTLKEARSHWVSAARNDSPSRRRTARQILTLIGIGVARANLRGWTNKTFNSTPRKVK